MKNALFFFLFGLFLSNANAQSGHPRFSISINAGANGNFVSNTFNEQSGPGGHQYFYNKRFIGSAVGLSSSLRISNKLSVLLDYSRLCNTGRKSYAGSLNGVDISIRDFRLRDMEHIYAVGVAWSPLRNFAMESGICLDYMSDQQILLEAADNAVTVDERNFKNSRLTEAGMFLGIHLTKQVDTKFKIGLKVRGYYLVSSANFEAITITPTLVYTF